MEDAQVVELPYSEHAQAALRGALLVEGVSSVRGNGGAPARGGRRALSDGRRGRS